VPLAGQADIDRRLAEKSLQGIGVHGFSLGKYSTQYLLTLKHG